MLDPDLVLSTLISSLRDIPLLVTELGGLTDSNGDPTIRPHYYYSGTERSLATSIGNMSSPSILIAYMDYLGGNFDGMTIWKHRFEIYIRPKNAAIGRVGDPVTGHPAASPMHLWWLMFNSPLTSTGRNLRSLTLLDERLQIVDTPTLMHRQDELLADYFVGQMVWPEAGDD